MFVSLPLLLAAIAVASCYVPARRAAKERSAGGAPRGLADRQPSASSFSLLVTESSRYST